MKTIKSLIKIVLMAIGSLTVLLVSGFLFIGQWIKQDCERQAKDMYANQ